LKSFRLTRHKIRKKKTDEKNLVMTFQNHENNQLAIDSTSTINMLLLRNDNPLTIASNNKTHDQNLLYLQKALYIQMVDIYSMSQLPSHSNIPDIIGKYIDWNDQEKNQYYPIVYNSHFWNGRNQLIEINDTIHEHSIDIYFDIITLWKWQIMSQMEETWEKKSIITGNSEDGVDILREMLIETNIYILIITGFVSIFHFIFDILAFKNDITFHRDRKSMEGLSKRTMIINALFQFVILLYLLDNETSNMVLLSNSVGLVIELWKIQKSIHFTFFDKNGQLNFQWNDSKSHFKSQTMIYDEIATSHLGFVTMPLVIGYGIYSLLYQKHKCWYSWILNSLVGFIYMFGFITMTPQLFINYKLKSVAHLNWRTMTYKSINTFIDDLFAFIIKMPLMHRLACFRDDVIFFIFLYQRYKYQTDFTRINEYGQCSIPVNDKILMIRDTTQNTSDRKKTRKDAIDKLSSISSLT